MKRTSIKVMLSFLVLSLSVSLITGCSKSGLGYDPNDYITKVGKYAGLVIVREDTTVTEQEILDAIYADLSDYATINDVKEGTVVEGDRVLMDFTGSVDGKVYDNTQAKDYDYVLGSGKLLDGIDENLYGKTVGEAFVIDVKLPDDYYDGNLAGKNMSLEILIKSKRVTVNPELTDDFVAGLKVSEFNTVDKMKAYYRAELQTAKDEAADEKQVNDLWQAIVDSYEISSLPQSAVNAYVDALVEEAEVNAETYGVTYLNILSYMGFATESEFLSHCTKQAEQTVREDIVYYHIIGEIGISFSKKEAKKFAEENYMQFGYASSKQFLEAYGTDYIMEYLNKSALWDYLLENNQL